MAMTSGPEGLSAIIESFTEIADSVQSFPGVIRISLEAATALFAEVLERFEDVWRNYTLEGGEYEEDVQERDEALASYRRRWHEITGMEIPE